LGIGRTFQNLQLFDSLTVLENVMVGSEASLRSNLLASSAYWGPAKREDRQIQQQALEVLAEVGLANWAHKQASALPLAGQKLLAVARAIAGNPRLLLLDEPAAGMSRDAIADLVLIIRRLASDHDMAILLVEHHMGLVMQVSDHIFVMNQGQLLAEGDPDSIQAHPEVIAVYLGTGSEAQNAD
jgi:branched-chain amino acid transport system ATP-binding protein